MQNWCFDLGITRLLWNVTHLATALFVQMSVEVAK